MFLFTWRTHVWNVSLPITNNHVLKLRHQVSKVLIHLEQHSKVTFPVEPCDPLYQCVSLSSRSCHLNSGPEPRTQNLCGLKTGVLVNFTVSNGVVNLGGESCRPKTGSGLQDSASGFKGGKTGTTCMEISPTQHYRKGKNVLWLDVKQWRGQSSDGNKLKITFACGHSQTTKMCSEQMVARGFSPQLINVALRLIWLTLINEIPVEVCDIIQRVWSVQQSAESKITKQIEISTVW